MTKEDNKTLMKILEKNSFNEDMELIQKYSELIRNILIKMTVYKEFYIEELSESRHIINCIIGYSQIIRKNDLKSARNYLRTCSASGHTLELCNNISKKLKEILDNDKFWNEEIDKTQIMFDDNKKPKVSASQRLNETLEKYRGNSIEEKGHTKHELGKMIFSEEDRQEIASELTELWNDDEFWGENNNG